ncbi:hypothetical protein BGZ79_010081 [Entomortierella chlamydospora]|nr:hypothetical protein BGZ79_010081 [Entomortierella chlamydospora]
MLSISTILFVAAFIDMTNAGTWCGKSYSEPTNQQPSVSNSGVFAALPPWPPADALAVTPRWKPIYETDDSVEFVVDVPSDIIETNIIFYFGAGKTHETHVHPGVNVIAVPKAKVGVTSTVTALLGSARANATFTIYKRPSPGTQIVVRVDYMHGSLVQETTRAAAAAATPVFPFGMYVEYEPFTVKDPVGAMKELRDMGINFINIVPPYDARLKAVLEAAKDHGIWVQYDMRHTYVSAVNITAEINDVKSYESIFSWYTSDEPDGELTASEPRNSINAYNTVNSIDPHRPTMLALNCMRNSAGQYANAADILMTDVYPIGISTKACNAEIGCCGCDECIGDFAIDIRHRMHSYRSQLAQVGKPRMPIWMVTQAFSDPNTYWSREATPSEFRLISYISLIHGAKGVLSWIYPGNMSPKLRAIIPTLSAELVPLGSKFILGGKQIVEYSDGKITAGAWIKDNAKLFVVTNPTYRQVTLTNAQIKAIFGDDYKLIKAGETLPALAIRIITA